MPSKSLPRYRDEFAPRSYYVFPKKNDEDEPRDYYRALAVLDSSREGFRWAHQHLDTFNFCIVSLV